MGASPTHRRQRVASILLRSSTLSTPLDRVIATERTAHGGYAVQVAQERNQASDDIARQVVTTIGTLVVAIAAFSLGAKSVERAGTEATRAARLAARSNTEKLGLHLLQPTLLPIPLTKNASGRWLPARFKMSRVPPNQRLSARLMGDGTGLLTREEGGSFIYQPGNPEQGGAVQFYLTEYPEVATDAPFVNPPAVPSKRKGAMLPPARL